MKEVFYLALKTALVTGGSRGIGRACVLSLAKEGYTVFFIYEKNEEAAEEVCRLAKENGYACYALKADIADYGQVEKAVHHVLSVCHRLDVLVNNAGIARQQLFSDVTEEDWNRMFDVNVKGAYHLCRACLPALRESGGGIINISSMWGQVGASCEVPYSATKAALIGMTKALAKEAGPAGVRVNCICPGVIDTDMNRALGQETLNELKDETPLCRLGTPQDIADAVVFFSSPKSAFITGQVLGVNGGFVI